MAQWRIKLDAQLVLSLVAAVGLVLYFALYLQGSAPPRDPFGFVLGRDFVNFWMGGRAALEGRVGDLFHLGVFQKRLQDALGAMPPHNWSYPPVLLLFLWPLGFFGYLHALILWLVTGFAAYLGAAASFARTWRYLLFVAAAPVLIVNFFSGQNGFFTAALLMLIFRFWDERPRLAGLCLGLMLYKPHLAVLYPLALALSGRWRVFFSAAATVLLSVALTAFVFGQDVWSDYVRLVWPVQQGVMNTGTGFLNMMPTGFMQARMLGASVHTAWLVQAPFTLLALAALVIAFRSKGDAFLKYAVLVTASFVVSPYAFNYDMVVFGWLIAMLWPRMRGLKDRLLLLAVWTLPLTMVELGNHFLPIAAPLMAVFLIRLVQKIRGGDRLPAALVT